MTLVRLLGDAPGSSPTGKRPLDKAFSKESREEATPRPQRSVRGHPRMAWVRVWPRTDPQQSERWPMPRRLLQIPPRLQDLQRCPPGNRARPQPRIPSPSTCVSPDSRHTHGETLVRGAKLDWGVRGPSSIAVVSSAVKTKSLLHIADTFPHKLVPDVLTPLPRPGPPVPAAWGRLLSPHPGNSTPVQPSESSG